jgi:four helix bundle protein
MGFRFRQFPIYQELRQFIKDLYLLSAKFPRQEQFELGSQLRRAATSSLLNLAEGAMRGSDAELNRFLLISIGSISEIVAILDICLDQKYLNASTHQQYVLKCQTLTKKLYSFRKTLKLKS